MNCRRYEKQIALYVEGDLSNGKARRVTRHLDGCPECREFAEDLKNSQVALKSLRHETINEEILRKIKNRVMYQIKEETVKTRRRGITPYRTTYLKIGLAACFMALIVVSGLVLFPEETPIPMRATQQHLLESPTKPSVSSNPSTVKPEIDSEPLADTGTDHIVQQALPSKPWHQDDSVLSTRKEPSHQLSESRATIQPESSYIIICVHSSNGSSSRMPSTNSVDSPAGDILRELLRLSFGAPKTVTVPGGATASPGQLMVHFYTDDPDVVIHWILDYDNNIKEDKNGQSKV